VAHREGQALPKVVGEGNGALLQEGREETCAESVLDRLEGRPAVRYDTLQVLPLGLEGLGQSRVGCLRELVGCGGQKFDSAGPGGDARGEPLGPSFCTAKEATKVAVASGKLEGELFQWLSGGGGEAGGTEDDTLGRLGVVPPLWAVMSEKGHGFCHLVGVPDHGSIIGVPALGDTGNLVAEECRQWGKGEAVEYHGEWVALRYALIGEEGVAGFPMAAEDEDRGMAVGVESEAGAC
jgi:hypothetical protein